MLKTRTKRQMLFRPRKNKKIIYKEKKIMKKLISLSMVLLLVLTSVFAFSVSAAEEDTIIHNLLPAANDANGKVTATDCELTYNDDGSVTFTITGSAPSVTVVFAEGTTVYAGDSFNVKDGEGFVVYDYASIDGATLHGNGGTVAHYTRKDKAASGALADLFLSSMESADYATYSKASGTGYGIWDLGEYIVKGKGDAGTFDDGMHRIDNITYALAGDVGASLVIYRFYVGSSDTVEGLGANRPAAKPEALEGKFDIFDNCKSIWAKTPVNEAEITIETTDGVTVVGGSVTNTWPWADAVLPTPLLIGEGTYLVYDLSFDVGKTSLRINGGEHYLHSFMSTTNIEGGTGDLLPGEYKGYISYEQLVELVGANEEGLVEITQFTVFSCDGAVITFNTFEFDSEYVPSETPDVSDPETSTPADDSSEPADDSSEPADESSAPATNDSSAPDTSDDASEEKGGNTGLIIGIVAGVVAVVAIVVVVVVVSKKKK